MITVAMSCPEYGISPISPSSSYYILFTFFSTVFLDLGGDAIQILFRAELSTITYSQHPVLPRVSAFTVVHRKKEAPLLKAGSDDCINICISKGVDTKSIYLNDNMELSQSITVLEGKVP